MSKAEDYKGIIPENKAKLSIPDKKSLASVPEGLKLITQYPCDDCQFHLDLPAPRTYEDSNSKTCTMLEGECKEYVKYKSQEAQLAADQKVYQPSLAQVKEKAVEEAKKEERERVINIIENYDMTGVSNSVLLARKELLQALKGGK